MSENLDRAQCERLRDMGMPQDVKPGDWVYVAGGVTPTLWLEFHKPAMGHIKLPSNDELEAFAIGKAREWIEPETSWRLVVWWRESKQEYAAFVESGEDEIIDHLVAASPSKSLALYNLIEKLDAMIAKETD